MRKALTIFLGAYALVLILLIPSKGLWVDEIIDLNGVRGASDVNGVLAFVPGNAGGVPLALRVPHEPALTVTVHQYIILGSA